MNLEDMAAQYENEGYTEENAQARVCQDIVLKAIAKSSLRRNVTIKGGVVMRSITDNARRATKDMDLDFIQYSLKESAIRLFVDKLNCLQGVTIRITGSIEELSQQEYNGKRIYIILSDDTGHSFKSKIDLGVHKDLQIMQDEYCFDVCLDDDGASLLINSKEQIFAEKLRSLLRFGPLSTRYKDIYDLCYLTDHVDISRLRECITNYIYNDPQMRENDINAVRSRITRTLSNRTFRANLENSQRGKQDNWLQVKTSDALYKITEFLKTIE